jgi:hypothetical protein
MTTPVPTTESAYVHSDDESLPLDDATTPSDDESDEEPRDPDEIDTKLLDAEDFVFEQNKGGLDISLYGPSQASTKVSGILTHAGKLVRIEEEGAGYMHPSFGAFSSLSHISLFHLEVMRIGVAERKDAAVANEKKSHIIKLENSSRTPTTPTAAMSTMKTRCTLTARPTPHTTMPIREH